MSRVAKTRGCASRCERQIMGNRSLPFGSKRWQDAMGECKSSCGSDEEYSSPELLTPRRKSSSSRSMRAAFEEITAPSPSFAQYVSGDNGAARHSISYESAPVQHHATRTAVSFEDELNSLLPHARRVNAAISHMLKYQGKNKKKSRTAASSSSSKKKRSGSSSSYSARRFTDRVSRE